MFLTLYILGVIINIGWFIGYRIVTESREREPFWVSLLCVAASWLTVGILFGITSGGLSTITDILGDILDVLQEESEVEEEKDSL